MCIDYLNNSIIVSAWGPVSTVWWCQRLDQCFKSTSHWYDLSFWIWWWCTLFNQSGSWLNTWHEEGLNWRILEGIFTFRKRILLHIWSKHAWPGFNACFARAGQDSDLFDTETQGKHVCKNPVKVLTNFDDPLLLVRCNLRLIHQNNSGRLMFWLHIFMKCIYEHCSLELHLSWLLQQSPVVTPFWCMIPILTWWTTLPCFHM